MSLVAYLLAQAAYSRSGPREWLINPPFISNVLLSDNSN